MKNKRKPVSIVKIVNQYKIEVFFLSLAFTTTLISIFLYLNTASEIDNQMIKISSIQTENEKMRARARSKNNKIFVEVSGAIKNPDVYQVTSGARLKDVLLLAGGLSYKADKQFFARNFNLAQFVYDQEKIHVPSREEVASGIFEEPRRLVDYSQLYRNPNLSPQTNNTPTSQNQTSLSSTKKININQAPAQELDTLPGVGPITAQKIIDNRPYKSIEELALKKIVRKDVYQKIKNQISVD